MCECFQAFVANQPGILEWRAMNVETGDIRVTYGIRPMAGSILGQGRVAVVWLAYCPICGTSLA